MKKLLLLVMASLILSESSIIKAEILPQADLSSDEALSLNKYCSSLLKNNESLLERFQSLGHYINKGNSGLSASEKKATSKWISENQNNINIINKKLVDNPSEALVAQYAIKTNSMVLALNVAMLSNFKNLIHTDITIKRSVSSEPVNVEKVLDSVENQMETASTRINQLGFTKLNLAIRKLEEIDFRYGITSKTKSVLLYSLIATIAFRFISKDKVTDRFYIGKLKNLVDNNFFPSKKDYTANAIDPKSNITPTEESASNRSRKETEENDSFLKTLLAGVISAVIIDSVKGDLGEVVKKIYQNILRDINSVFSESYSWLRGTPSTVSSGGYEYVGSSNTLEDPKLVGLENQKLALGQLVNALKNLTIFEKAKININKAYLITGPAGCGKSFLAKAVCGSVNKNLEDKGLSNKIGFKEVKFSDLIWKTEEGITQLVKDAQSQAPCILFIDEIHLLRLQTEGNGKALTEFLTVLSGINSENSGLKPVIIIAATNRPDLLDPALLRSGRFEVVKVEKPNLNTRKEYFQIMLKDQGINTDNFDIERLAKLTENCSYAQLDQVIKSARFKAKSQARGISSTQDLEDSIDNIIFKIKNEKVLPISEESKKIIASHLAGKTLSQILFDDKINQKILKVTLKATIPAVKESMMFSPQDKMKAIKEKKTKYGHIFTYSKDEVSNFEDEQSLESQCKVLLSGKIAEQLILGTQHVVRKSDKTKALELAKNIAYNGIKSESLTKNLLREYESKALSMLDKFEQQTKIILEKNKDKLEKIYQDLLEKQTLSRSDLIQESQN